MPYWLKCVIVLVILWLAAQFFFWALKKIGLINNDAEPYKGVRRGKSINPKTQRALEIQKLYIAREFFLKPGVLRRRSSPGTDEDDR